MATGSGSSCSKGEADGGECLEKVDASGRRQEDSRRRRQSPIKQDEIHSVEIKPSYLLPRDVVMIRGLGEWTAKCQKEESYF
jgi:hypothetical protein